MEIFDFYRYNTIMETTIGSSDPDFQAQFPVDEEDDENK